MGLRENQEPTFQSYRHPKFNNVEYQMYQEEVLDNEEFRAFQKEEKYMHGAYKPQRKVKLTWDEIKAGSPYTIEQLAGAAYTYVLTQMMAHKAIKDENIRVEAAAMLVEYVQLRDKRVYKDDVDQDAITDEDDRKALNPIDLVKLKRDG